MSSFCTQSAVIYIFPSDATIIWQRIDEFLHNACLGGWNLAQAGREDIKTCHLPQASRIDIKTCHLPQAGREDIKTCHPPQTGCEDIKTVTRHRQVVKTSRPATMPVTRYSPAMSVIYRYWIQLSKGDYGIGNGELFFWKKLIKEDHVFIMLLLVISQDLYQ